jgi:Tfp pilus assembly protein PilE
MKKIRSFTLIEMFISIAVIAILVTFVVPATYNALIDAKTTSPQTACKVYEDSILQADAMHNNRVKTSAKVKTEEMKANPLIFQKDIYRVLVGSVKWDERANPQKLNGSDSPGVYGEYEIKCDDGKFYESLIEPSFYDINEKGFVLNVPTSDPEPPIAKNDFERKYQIAYRLNENNGSIVVYHPETREKLEINGIKPSRHPVRVVTFDNETPAKLITREGAFKLFVDKECEVPVHPEEWNNTDKVFIKSDG